MHFKNYWPLVLNSLKKDLSNTVFKMWFSTLEFVQTDNEGRKIILNVASKFNKKYLETKYKKELLTAINRFYPKVIHIDFNISEKETDTDNKQDSVFDENSTSENIIKPIINKRITLTKNLNNLNPKYSFNNFVTTSANQLAVNVAKKVIDNPGMQYNPLFIYSGVGLGKTHLLQAIGQAVLEARPDSKIKYTTCETFFNLFIDSIQNKNSRDFKDYFRNVDYLLIDDIQFIAGKESTQEAFFHTFNQLHQENKQIILTCDKSPKQLDRIEERLISRFEWGIVIDISKPELEDRITVLKDKVARLKLNLNLNQITKIAEIVNTNFRDLEGVLNRIQARNQLIPDKVMEEYELNQILAGYKQAAPIQINIGNNNKNLKTSEKIINTVCEVFELTKEEIMGRNRHQNVALARQICMYLLKEEFDYSYPVIGKIFSRDHTTAMHAHKKISETLDKKPKIQQKLEFIKTCI
jgi:chromosomal replication initiator protein